MELEELTECCLCTEIFTDPRILPCIHSFCLRCLDQTASVLGKKSGEQMPCPLCRKDFRIPSEGMIGLQKNFFMTRLIEMTKISKPLKSIVPCAICLSSSETPETEVASASKYCIECQDNLCDVCSMHHKKQRLSRDHHVILYGSEIKEETVTTFARQFCNEHDSKPLEMFCADCKKVICMMCFAESHQSHKCSDVKKVADLFRKQMGADLDGISTCLNDVLEENNEYYEKKTEFLRRLELVEVEINQRGAELKELVDKSMQSLLSELAVLKQDALKQMETYKEEMETRRAIFDGFKLYCSELRGKGSPSDICSGFNDLEKRANELQQMHKTRSQGEIFATEISFEASKLDEFLKNQNVVGTIKDQELLHVSDTKESVTKQRNNSDCVHLIGRVKLLFEVGGVTKLENTVCILCPSPNLIIVFEDQKPFRQLKKIEIKEIVSPWNIGSSEKSKCLYVSDQGNKCIWKITTDNGRVIKWLENVSYPFTLSVTSEGHMLVLRDGSPSNSSVEVYESDAKFIRSLLLPSYIQDPLHAIQKPSGDFIISHRVRDWLDATWNKRWVISQLTSDGQMIRHVNPRNESEELNYPKNLSLDSEKNRLFVADKWNNRVIVFDSNSLKCSKILLTKKEIGSGRRGSFFHDGNKKQLTVAHGSSAAGIVDVYEVMDSFSFSKGNKS